MSADLWLEIDTGGPEPAEVSETFNVTYNLSGMLRAAGYPGHREMIGAPASEAGGVFLAVADRLRTSPDDFREHLPENGWGTVEWAVEFCDLMAKACAQHPAARIGGWL